MSLDQNPQTQETPETPETQQLTQELDVVDTPAEEVEQAQQIEDISNYLPRILNIIISYASKPALTHDDVKDQLHPILHDYFAIVLDNAPNHVPNLDSQHLAAMCDDTMELLLSIPELVHGLNLMAFVNELPSDIDTMFERCRWLSILEKRNEPLMFYPTATTRESHFLSKSHTDNLNNLVEVFSNVMAATKRYTDNEFLFKHLVKPFVVALIYPVFACIFKKGVFALEAMEETPTLVLPIYMQRYLDYVTPKYKYTSALKNLPEKDNDANGAEVEEDKVETEGNNTKDKVEDKKAMAEVSRGYTDYYRLMKVNGETFIEELDEDGDWARLQRGEGPVAEAAYDSVIREFLDIDSDEDAVYTVMSHGRSFRNAIKDVVETKTFVGTAKDTDATEITFFKFN